MPTTYTLIASNTLGSNTASVTFNSIPQTYKDLVLIASVRTNSGSFDYLSVKPNGDEGASGPYSHTRLVGDGGSATSARFNDKAFQYVVAVNGTTSTSNTFGSTEIYFPNYTSTNSLPMYGFSVNETNASTAYIGANALLWRGAAAMTSLVLSAYNGSSLLSGSSFYLYGIKKS